MDKKLTFKGANIIFLIFTLVFISIQIGISFLASKYGREYIETRLYETLSIIQIIAVFIPTYIYIRIKKVNIKKVLRINKLKIVHALIIVLASVPALYFCGSVNNILILLFKPLEIMRNNNQLPIPQSFNELIIGLGFIALMPSIFEEFMNRGLFLRAYESKGSYKAVIISAFLFGISHYNITNLIFPILLGILIGYYVIRTNSILAGFLAHFMNNAISLITAYIFKDYIYQNITLSGNERITGLIIIIIISGGFLSCLLIWFHMSTKKHFTYIKPRNTLIKDIKELICHLPITISLIIYIALQFYFIYTI